MSIIIIAVAHPYRPVAVAGTVLWSPQQPQGCISFPFLSDRNPGQATCFSFSLCLTFISCMTCLLDWKAGYRHQGWHCSWARQWAQHWIITGLRAAGIAGGSFSSALWFGKPQVGSRNFTLVSSYNCFSLRIHAWDRMNLLRLCPEERNIKIS